MYEVDFVGLIVLVEVLVIYSLIRIVFNDVIIILV